MECQRKLDDSNGQQWWVCHHCDSTWHELVNGRKWLPLSCPDRPQKTGWDAFADAVKAGEI